MAAARSFTFGSPAGVSTSPFSAHGEPTHAYAADLSRDEHFQFARPSLVELEANETTRSELVKVVIAWLVKEGFTSSAQLLREEANTLLREEHQQRKSVRAICRAVSERDWEGAQKAVSKLQSRISLRPQGTFQVDEIAYLIPLARSLPFLLAQQQFLELFDHDDSQRRYAFFMRSVKPFESSVPHELFQKLSYLLTCKTITDAAVVYPELRGWSAEEGRAQLLHYINKTAGDCLTGPYCRQGNITHAHGETEKTDGLAFAAALPSLESMATQSLAYELIDRQYPQLTRHNNPIILRSLSLPLSAQMLPAEPLERIDVGRVARSAALSRISGSPGGSATSTPQSPISSPSLPPHLTACEPVLSVPAVVVGCRDGKLFWVPLKQPTPYGSSEARWRLHDGQRQRSSVHGESAAAAPAAAEDGALMFSHRYSIKGLQRLEKRLLLWGGPQVAVFDLTDRIRDHDKSSTSLFNSSAGARLDGLTRFDDTYAAGSLTDKGGEELTHTFAHGSDVMASCFFPCGTVVAAGLSDGTVAVWETVNGTKMFENTFGKSPVVSILASHSGSMYYAGTKDGTVFAVDVATGVRTHTIAAPASGELASLALSPSSSLLLASYRGGTVRLYDLILGRQLPYRIQGAGKSAQASVPVTFGSQDSHVIAGTAEGCLCFWNLDEAEAAGRETPGSRGPLPTRDVGVFAHLSARAQSPHLLSATVASNRWPEGLVVKPAAQLTLHRSCVKDVKVEGACVVSCSDDGMLYICGSKAVS